MTLWISNLAKIFFHNNYDFENYNCSAKIFQCVALKVKLSPPKHVIVVLGLTLFITICYVTLCNHLAG